MLLISVLCYLEIHVVISLINQEKFIDFENTYFRYQYIFKCISIIFFNWLKEILVLKGELFLKGLFIYLILFLFVFSYAGAQTINTKDLNLKITKGDSNTYTVNLLTGITNRRSHFYKNDGRTLDYNVTKGQSLTVKIVDKNSTKSDSNEIFVQKYLNIPNKGGYQSSITDFKPFNVTEVNWFSFTTLFNYLSFFTFSFQTQKDAQYYYSKTITNYMYDFSFESDFITITQFFNTKGLIIPIANIKINWKTGWIENIQINLYNRGNGTLLNSFILQRQDNIFSNLFNSVSRPTELITLSIILIVLVVMGLSYKDYSKNTKNLKNKESFRHFLLYKVRYPRIRKKNKSNFIIQNDKALEMIEEIINENK